MNDSKKNDNTELEKYAEVCTESIEEYISKNKISLNGLTNEEAQEKIKKYGYNEVKQGKQKKWYNYLLQSLFSPFNSILLGIAVVLSYTDVVLASEPSYANILVIIILVLVSTFLEFFEEYSSNKSAEKLKELVATTAEVIRDGKKEKIILKNIVKGDIVNLSAGEMIPADLKIIESKDLYLRESSLTGESDAIKKSAISEKKIEEIDGISDLDTICFMGTNVISRKWQSSCNTYRRRHIFC